MIVRLRHVKRVRSKGHIYWYHRKTGERLLGDIGKKLPLAATTSFAAF